MFLSIICHRRLSSSSSTHALPVADTHTHTPKKYANKHDTNLHATHQVAPIEPVPVLQVLREEGHGVLRPVGLHEGQVEVVEEEDGAVALLFL